MIRRLVTRDESGVTLPEVLLSTFLFSIVIVTVDASLTVVQTHQVEVNDRTQALDNLQVVAQAINRDIHAASSWTTPAAATSTAPVTATTLGFTALLGSGTPTISISLNTATHQLTVTCTGAGCRPTGTGTVQQAQISNIDSSTLFTLTPKEVSTNGTNTFFYTSVASTLVLDTPKVGAPKVFKTTLSAPNLVANNVEYACQSALGAIAASGSC